MPKRIKLDTDLVIATFNETKSGRETARRLGIHENTVYQITRMLLHNKCKYCGGPKNTKEIYCPKCRKTLATRQRVKRAEKRRLGLCTQCDKPFELPSTTYCADHRLKFLQQAVQQYKKKRGQPNGDVTNERQKFRYLRARFGQPGIDVWIRDEGSCVICHATYAEKSIHIHHKDRNEDNHTAENMVCLCFHCHQTVHRVIEHPNLQSLLEFMRSVYSLFN